MGYATSPQPQRRPARALVLPDFQSAVSSGFSTRSRGKRRKSRSVVHRVAPCSTASAEMRVCNARAAGLSREEQLPEDLPVLFAGLDDHRRSGPSTCSMSSAILS